MLTIIIIGFLAAIAAPFIHRWLPRLSGPILCIYPLIFFGYLFSMIPAVSEGEKMVLTHQWFPSLGINLNFLVDGLSLIFGLIISGIGAIIVFYASSYLKGHRKLARFYGYLLFFMTSMLGVVLSDNIFALFIFWELTSISSYLLIGFNHEQERSRYAALQALLVTGGGGLAMMAGLLMLSHIGGTTSISELMNQSALVAGHGLYLPIMILILLGAFTKSAQWPFHFWLPNAMEAPTPVSAYLHSATMVKAGVFLIARLNPVMAGPEIWHTVLMSFGAVTMVMGAAMAVGQHDLKRILAYTTVSALGIMVFLLGMGGKYAVTAAITFLAVHALYKGGLFLVAGAIDHETGTRDIRKLAGLSKFLPLIAVAAIMAALSYAGIPPFFGFIAKELIYEAAVHYPINAALFTSAAIATNMFLVATAIMVGIKPFFGKFIETPKKPHPAPFALWIGPLLMGALGLIFGLFPSIMSKALITPGVDAIAGMQAAKLALWHGFNFVLLLSGITLAGGVLIYFLTPSVRKQMPLFNNIAKVGPEAWYNYMLKSLVKVAAFQTGFFQNGKLRSYFFYILAVFLGLTLFTIVKNQIYTMIAVDLTDVYFYEILIIAIMFFSAILSVVSRSVLGAVAALGMVGFGVALLFAFLSAPDLALTQFSIETLTVILLVLVVYKFPKMENYLPVGLRIKDAVISILSGATLTVLILIFMHSPADTRISHYFLENSYILAHGRNVVNVILVDFRALDTMGEITVLALAVLGVYVLLKFRVRDNQENES